MNKKYICDVFLYDSQREVNVPIRGIDSCNSSQYLENLQSIGKTLLRECSHFYNIASKCIQVSIIIAFDENLLSIMIGGNRLFVETWRALLLNQTSINCCKCRRNKLKK